MKKGCLLSLLLWGALGACYYYILHERYEPPADWIGAIVGSLLSLFGIGALRNIALQIRDSRLVKAATRARIPNKREVTAITGRIHSVDEPLLSPFTHTPCVLYSYEIFDRYTQKVGSGSDRRSETRTDKYLSGFQMRPCSVKTAWGEVKLFGFPELDGYPEVIVADPSAIQKAESFIEKTKFENISGFKITKAIGEMKDLFSDIDGTIDKNWRMKDFDSLKGLYLQEQIVKENDEVCAIGLYDPTKSGLVIDVSGGTPLRIIQGNTESALAKIRKSTIGNFFLAIFFLAIGNGVLYFVLYQHLYSASQVKERTTRFNKAIEENDLNKMSSIGKFAVDLTNSSNPSEIPIFKAKSLEAARLLIEMGSSINLTDSNGRTPLMRAIDDKLPDLAKLFINKGAELNIKDNWGETALTIADSKGESEIATLLRKLGAHDEVVTRSNGEPTNSNSQTYKICVEYLAAVQRADVETLKKLYVDRTSDTFDSVDFETWKVSRPTVPVLVEGFENERRATISITDSTKSYMLWRYQLIKEASGWKIEKERWIR